MKDDFSGAGGGTGGINGSNGGNGTGGPEPGPAREPVSTGKDGNFPKAGKPGWKTKWCARPDGLERVDGPAEEVLQTWLNDPEIQNPPVKVIVKEVKSFALRFYVCREKLWQARRESQDAFDAASWKKQQARKALSRVRAAKRQAQREYERAVSAALESGLKGRALRHARKAAGEARRKKEAAAVKLDRLKPMNSEKRKHIDEKLRETLNALRDDISKDRSRNRLRLIQFRYISANGGGTASDENVYVSWLIADYGENGKAKPRKLFALDWTNLPLFRILDETDPELRFHPRGAALIKEAEPDKASAWNDIRNYLHFHFFAIRGSGGHFEIIHDLTDVGGRFDPDNSMELEPEDLDKTLARIPQASLPLRYVQADWQPMVNETPAEHVAMGVDSTGVTFDFDDWRQPMANSVHHCTAHLLFSNRIYRANIALTEMSGVVDLSTLHVLQVNLPIKNQPETPFDRLELMTDENNMVRFRPTGWQDACHVDPDDFILAAKKGHEGFKRLYYWHHLEAEHPADFRNLEQRHETFRQFLNSEGVLVDVAKRFPWINNEERRAFYVTKDVSANGQVFKEQIDVRAYFEQHVILESAKFKNSLNLSRCVFRRSLDLSNSEIDGKLDLSGTLIEAATAYRRGKARLDLDHAIIKGPLIARGLQVGRGTLASIRSSHRPGETQGQGRPLTVAVRPISARSTKIEGEVDLRGVKAGALDFDSAEIRGNFTLSSERFEDSSQNPGSRRRGDEPYADRIKKNPNSWEATKLRDANWGKADALASINLVRLDFADVDGDITLSGLHALYLFLRSVKIRGNLNLGPVRFQGGGSDPSGQPASNLKDCIVTHVLRCIDMDFAQIRGIIHGEGLHTGFILRAEKAFETLLAGRYADWELLENSRERERLPTGDVHMSFIEASAVGLGSFPAGGTTKVIRSQIVGKLAMQGLRTKGAVELDGALIAGDLDLSLSTVGGMVSAKPVETYCCEIFGDMILTNTQARGAAEFDGLWIGRSLRMPEASFEEFFMRAAFVKRDRPLASGQHAWTHCICNPNIGHQFNADNVKIRGTMNLTGIQIGFRTAFQGERKDEDRDEKRDRLNMRYADIKGPFLLWQGATVRTVARGLSAGAIDPDLQKSSMAAACFGIRTRIFGDIKLNHATVGAGLCLINTLVTGRAIFADASVGGDISTEWPASLERPEADGTMPLGIGGGARPDHEWPQLLATVKNDMEPPKRNYLEVEDQPGCFQCCQLNLELVECRGDGYFCDTEVFDLEKPHRKKPAIPFDDENPLPDHADYAPDFLARQATFHGRIEFAPWRDESEKLTALSRRLTGGDSRRGCRETIVKGKLDLSFAQASFAILDAWSFRSTMLDYAEVARRLKRLQCGSSRLKRKLAGHAESIELRKFLRGRRKKGMAWMPTHLRTRLDELIPETKSGRSRLTLRRKKTDLPPILVSEIRRLDLDAFGVDLERARIAHLEFLPYYEEKKTRNRKFRIRDKNFHFISGEKKFVEFPQSVNLHGLEVKRWDIKPAYFGFLLDAQPGFEQSTYTMIQRELQDQGHVKEAMDIYARMRRQQRKFKTWAGRVVDRLESFCFKYFTRPLTWRLVAVLVIWLAFSTLIVFSNPRNVMPAPDSIENTKLTWRSNPHDAMKEGSLHDWGLGESFLVSLHYHLPFLRLRPGEKWQASDTEPLCFSFFSREINEFCPDPGASPPPYGNDRRLENERRHAERVAGGKATWGLSKSGHEQEAQDHTGQAPGGKRIWGSPEDLLRWSTLRTHIMSVLHYVRALLRNSLKYVQSAITPEIYASITALVHWLIYPFVIIAMSATVVRNRTAGQGRSE